MIRFWMAVSLLSFVLMGCGKEIVMTTDDVMKLRDAALSRELGKDTFITGAGVTVRIQRGK